MRRPSRRISRVLGFTVVPVSLVATGLFVTASSYSVFNATTTNPNNTWTAGSMTLADSQAGVASFTPTALYPSNTASTSSGSRCITVNYTGANIPANIKLYASGVPAAGANQLATGLTITVETGSGGTNSSTACTGFTRNSTVGNVFSGTLATFQGLNSYSNAANASGTATWTPSTTASQQYMISWKFASNGVPTSSTTEDNQYQGKSTGVNFVWEAQNS